MPTYPRFSRNQLVEPVTRRLVESAIHPWQVAWQDAFDMGVDGICHCLGEADKLGDHPVPGECFLLQLKGLRVVKGSLKRKIEVAHINMWRRAPAPVMLIVCPESGPARYRWIDDNLLAWLNANRRRWAQQGTVTIPFEDAPVLERDRFGEILDNVRAKTRRVGPVDPRRFLAVYGDVVRIGRGLAHIAQTASEKGPHTELNNLVGKLGSALYGVVVAGRTRAGKSTLINAMLERELSPVERVATTAVPMFFEPGASDQVVVHKRDGERIELAPKVEEIANYATQDENQGNRKGVESIRVRVTSSRLEPGIMLIDAPGLADPDPAMRDATAAALRSAHAVIYVFSGGLYQSGDFAIQQADTDALKSVAGADRIFLVLNKADMLDDDLREPLAQHVSERLRWHGFSTLAELNPYFISAQGATEGNDPGFDRLIADVWEFLLERGDVGLGRLSRLCDGVLHAGSLLHWALRTARDKNIQAADLRRSADRLQNAREQMLTKWGTDFSDAQGRLESGAWGAVNDVSARCVAWLRAVPAGQPLPTADAIQTWLTRGYNAASKKQVSTLVAYVLFTIPGQMEAEVRGALQEEVNLLQPDASSSFPNAPTHTVIAPVIDTVFPGGWLAVAGLGLLMEVFEVAAGRVLALLALFGLGASGRTRQQNKYINQIEGSTGAAYSQIVGPMTRWLEEQRREQLSRLDSEFGAYVDDMHRRAAEAEEATTCGVSEINTMLDEVDGFLAEVKNLSNERP